MTERVGRDVLSVQRWAVLFGGGDGPVQPVLDTGAGKWCAGSVGEHWRVWCWADSVQPAAELGGGVLPEWDGTLLAALCHGQNYVAPVRSSVPGGGSWVTWPHVGWALLAITVTSAT
jgi:hypothetical protein